MTKHEITQLSYAITGCAIHVHKELGPGLLEGVYQQCLRYELRRKGFDVIHEVMVPVAYGNMILDTESGWICL